MDSIRNDILHHQHVETQKLSLQHSNFDVTLQEIKKNKKKLDLNPEMFDCGKFLQTISLPKWQAKHRRTDAFTDAKVTAGS